MLLVNTFKSNFYLQCVACVKRVIMWLENLNTTLLQEKSVIITSLQEKSLLYRRRKKSYNKMMLKSTQPHLHLWWIAPTFCDAAPESDRYSSRMRARLMAEDECMTATMDEDSHMNREIGFLSFLYVRFGNVMFICQLSRDSWLKMLSILKHKLNNFVMINLSFSLVTRTASISIQNKHAYKINLLNDSVCAVSNTT